MTNLSTTLTDPRLLSGIAELAQRNQWIVWKLQGRRNKQGELKQAKVPYNPCTHRVATSSFADHYTSFEIACAASPRYNGIGFVFTADDPYIGIDLDGCRDPQTGCIARWAWRWIMCLDSYTEVSPSGTGVKIFAHGTVPESIKAELGPHVDIEVYSQRRYFCVTGQHLPGTSKDIGDAQEALTHLYLVLSRLQRARRFAQRPRLKTKSTIAPTPRSSPAEAAAGRLLARETIDRANTQHDLGVMMPLLFRGATIQRLRTETRYRYAIEADNATELPEVIRGKGYAYRGVHEDQEWEAWWRTHYGPPPLPLWVVPTQKRLEVVHHQWCKSWPEPSPLLPASFPIAPALLKPNTATQSTCSVEPILALGRTRRLSRSNVSVPVSRPLLNANRWAHTTSAYLSSSG